MKLHENSQGLWLLNAQDLQLEKVFESGQTFRFQKKSLALSYPDPHRDPLTTDFPSEIQGESHSEDDENPARPSAFLCAYEGVARGRFLTIEEYRRPLGEGRDILLRGVNRQEYKKIWKDYFDLSRSYGTLRRNYSTINPDFKKAVAYGKGLRILQQEPVEVIFTFILSANNHFRRIQHGINTLCRFSHQRILDREGRVHDGGPVPEKIAALTGHQIQELRAGYRAPYLLKTAEILAKKEIDLEALFQMSTPEAAKELQRLPGVGPKVADCILLFGFQKYDVFPVDTWIRQAMEQYWDCAKSPGQIREQGCRIFGDTAGIAQQYLFYYQRRNKK